MPKTAKKSSGPLNIKTVFGIILLIAVVGFIGLNLNTGGFGSFFGVILIGIFFGLGFYLAMEMALHGTGTYWRYGALFRLLIFAVIVVPILFLGGVYNPHLALLIIFIASFSLITLGFLLCRNAVKTNSNLKGKIASWYMVLFFAFIIALLIWGLYYFGTI